MKLLITLATMVALAMGDKPSPAYSSPSSSSYGSPKAPAQDSYGSPQAPAQDSYGSPKAPVEDSYGSPQAPVQDSYGSPQAPVQDSYGSPQAPVQESYGSPQANPVTPAAQGQVGTQGFYYYYYPVASSYGGSGGSHGGGSHAPSYGPPAAATGDRGGFSGIIPLLVGLGVLVVLALVAAAVFTGNGRRSLDSFVEPAQLDNLAYYVYEGIRLWTEVTQE